MVVIGVVGLDLISVRKERDNTRKDEVLRGMNRREIKWGNGDMYVGVVEVGVFY